MKITSAIFVAGLQGTDPLLGDGTPQVAFIGRSNVGKSSVINSVTGVEGLAKTSSFPGRTQAVNLFRINNVLYLVDLPGYGFARTSHKGQDRLAQIIDWYFFNSPYQQKLIVLIIDAQVGPTDNDFEMLRLLETEQKNVIIVANKIDKLKRMELMAQLKDIRAAVGDHVVIPYSATEGIGVRELTDAILK